LALVNGEEAGVALVLLAEVLWALTVPQGAPIQAAATVIRASDIRNADGGFFIFSISLFSILFCVMIFINNGTLPDGVVACYRVFTPRAD